MESEDKTNKEKYVFLFGVDNLHFGVGSCLRLCREDVKVLSLR